MTNRRQGKAEAIIGLMEVHGLLSLPRGTKTWEHSVCSSTGGLVLASAELAEETIRASLLIQNQSSRPCRHSPSRDPGPS